MAMKTLRMAGFPEVNGQRTESGRRAPGSRPIRWGLASGHVEPTPPVRRPAGGRLSPPGGPREFTRAPPAGRKRVGRPWGTRRGAEGGGGALGAPAGSRGRGWGERVPRRGRGTHRLAGRARPGRRGPARSPAYDPRPPTTFWTAAARGGGHLPEGRGPVVLVGRGAGADRRGLLQQSAGGNEEGAGVGGGLGGARGGPGRG